MRTVQQQLQLAGTATLRSMVPSGTFLLPTLPNKLSMPSGSTFFCRSYAATVRLLQACGVGIRKRPAPFLR